MRAEEQVERVIEPGDVVVPVHEETSERRPDIGAAPDPHHLERADRVNQAAVVHVEPGRPENPAEQQQVGREPFDRRRRVETIRGPAHD